MLALTAISAAVIAAREAWAVLRLRRLGKLRQMAESAARQKDTGLARQVADEYDAGAPNFLGLLVATTTTDDWDMSLPTGCQGEVFEFMGQPTDCYDGLRNFNQIRPGTFDGGYAFTECELDVGGSCVEMGTGGTPGPLPTGMYVVEVDLPASYAILKEEDRNVDFGDSYVPSTQLLPPPCVGSRTEAGLGPVPFDFTLFPLFDENGDPVAKSFAVGRISGSTIEFVSVEGGS